MSGKIVPFGKDKDGSGRQTDERDTAVDLGGLMTVLGKHLYSTPMVALRELVQNAHDSIIRRRLEDESFSQSTDTARITVKGDLARGIISITDTGAGLTNEEIHSYLATVGVGYTRTLREKRDDAGLIGMFGLGFLSAFVLSDEVTIFTTSYKEPDKGWKYHSRTGETYTVEESPCREVGTEVRLNLREDFRHLSGSRMLSDVLGKYCIALREPVFINDDTEALNPEIPPWRLPEAQTVEPPLWVYRKQMAFAEQFDPYFSPLCVIPVFSQTADAPLTGLLWVQDAATYGTSDNRRLSVFGRGMLLNDDARDLLPGWAGFISGIIESDFLTPTASREDLQKDEAYHAVKQSIAEALINGLARVPAQHPEAWRRILMRHNDALLGASLCDERLFDLLADNVRIRTSQGELPAAALKTASGAVHVCFGSQAGFEGMLFRIMRTPVARGELYAVIPFLRKWTESRGGMLVELGTEKGNRRMFTSMPLPRREIEWLGQALGDGEDIIPARFLPEELPLVVVRDQEAALKLRLEEDEADKRISAAALRLARNYTATVTSTTPNRLYINLGNPVIQAILDNWRNGQSTEPAVTLLRSLKVIMAAAGDSGDSLNVNDALGQFCSTVASLLKHPEQPVSSCTLT